MPTFFKIITASLLLAGCNQLNQNVQNPTMQANSSSVQVSSRSSEPTPIPSDVLSATVLTGTTMAHYLASNTLLVGSTGSVHTMTVFTNYECDYCTQFFIEQYPRVESDFIESNHLVVQIVPKVLEKYSRSLPIAKALHCVALQNRGYEFHNALIEATSYTDSELEEIASNVGVNTTAYATCIAAEETDVSVARQQSVISRMGIHLIPSFYIGAEKIVGLPTYTDLSGFIKLHSM